MSLLLSPSAGQGVDIPIHYFFGPVLDGPLHRPRVYNFDRIDITSDSEDGTSDWADVASDLVDKNVSDNFLRYWLTLLHRLTTVAGPRIMANPRGKRHSPLLLPGFSSNRILLRDKGLSNWSLLVYYRDSTQSSMHKFP